RHGAAEFVERLVVGTLYVGLLRPARSAAREEVNGPGFLGRVIILLAVDPLRRAVLELRRDGERVAVAADLQARTEPVFLAGIRGFNECLLRPLGPLADEYVDGADRRSGLAVVVA